MRNRRVNIYNKTNLNQTIRESSYSSQQPRLGNWGVASSYNCSKACDTKGKVLAPIAGWRKSLNCYPNCECYQTARFDPPGAWVTDYDPTGATITQTATGASGTITNYVSPSTTVGIITILLDDCDKSFNTTVVF